MISLLFVMAVSVWAIMYRQNAVDTATDIPQKVSEKLNKLWDIAHESMKENKLLRAEKALLTILRVDERNATAYNRLGILYAKQKAYKDAIECFEIAQSLEPSASSLHNVGLIYYETEQYEKAALAFEQALDSEDQYASRYIAYAKVLEKLKQHKKAVAILETAVKLEPSKQAYHILADTYERNGQTEEAQKLRQKLEKMVTKQNAPTAVRQPRKVV